MPTSSAATEMPYTPRCRSGWGTPTIAGALSLALFLRLPLASSMPRVLEEIYRAHHRSHSWRFVVHQEHHERDDGGENTMLMRTDPFRELDRLTQQVFGT